VGDVPVHLQQPGRGLGRGAGVGGREDRTERFVFLLAVGDEAVREQLVLDEGTGGPGRGDPLVRGVLRVVLAQRAVGQVDALGVVAEAVRRPEDVAAGVEVIRTALGDLVDHAAQRTTEFGAVTTGLDLLFLDRFERNVREVQAAERVGDVEAVDVVLVFGDGRTAERSQVAERRVAAHGTRGEQRHRGRVARNRDLGDLFGGQDGGRLDRRDVDRVDRTGADDFDRVEFAGRTGLHEVDVRSR